MLKDRLGSILVQRGIISLEQLDMVLTKQKDTGQKLATILIQESLVEEKKLIAILGEQLGIPPVDLTKLKLDPEVVELIPQGLAEFYSAIPISKIGNAITVAMSDPTNVLAVDDIKLQTGMDIIPALASETEISEILKNYYAQRSGMTEVLDDVDDMQVAESKQEEMDLDQLGAEGGEAPVIKIVNLILKEAINSRASDIHIEPFEKTISLRYRIDGVLHDRTAPPKALQNALVSRLKIMSKLDIAERRLPQDGRFRIKMKGKDIDFRFSTLPCVHGEKVVMRILDKSALNLDLSKLGFDPKGLEYFRDALKRTYGMILVTGPTGSGKTTTLYSSLSVLNEPDVNIVTVEDPVEYQLGGINQVQCQSEIGLTFAAALRSILRQDPDIVMIGEIRDLETAEIAVKAALTGHLVLSTLHTNDAPSAVARLDDMGIEPFLISSSVIAICAQRLGRKICEKCKEPVKTEKEILEQAQIPKKYIDDPNFVLYEGKGCRSCAETGYSGRTSIVEVFAVTDDMRRLIVERKSADVIKRKAIASGMLTLRMVALKKAIDGVMTLKEAVRVTSPDDLVDVVVPDY